ncbi:MAG: alpha/beta hydrolase [bacterium]|nr:alpha/beta hydrolase [bacterium]
MDTILILHGWGSCAKNWANVKELLENKGLKVFVPDLPGFGENPPPDRPWSIDDYVEWVRDFCEKNNLSNFFLAGHSFGGGIAAKYASRYTENIEKLFLVASAIVRRKTFKKEAFKRLAKILNKFSALPYYDLFRRAFYKIVVKSDYLSAKNANMRETYLKVIGEDLSSCLSNISTPTIIIWGEKDEDTLLKDAYLIKEKISGAVLETISGIGHSPHLESPEILAEKIIKFIKS